MKFILLIISFALTAQLKAQTASQITTTGNCSAVVVGNYNSINCGALTIDEARKLAAILNEVRNSNLSLDIVVGKLDAILAEIRKNENPNIGLVSYDVDGSKRTTSAGTIHIENGEKQVFSQEYDYEKQRRWHDEAGLAEREKLKVPEWLTPIFFAATAYANLCRVTDAATNLNSFIAKASKQPAYEIFIISAKEHLAQLPQIATHCLVPRP